MNLSHKVTMTTKLPTATVDLGYSFINFITLSLPGGSRPPYCDIFATIVAKSILYFLIFEPELIITKKWVLRSRNDLAYWRWLIIRYHESLRLIVSHFRIINKSVLNESREKHLKRDEKVFQQTKGMATPFTEDFRVTSLDLFRIFESPTLKLIIWGQILFFFLILHCANRLKLWYDHLYKIS